VVKPWCPHSPSPIQRDFLALDCEEALLGGAAGGGKTDALLMGALQFVDRPGYSAALFRRNEQDWQQAGSALQLANAWLAGTAAWWDQRKRSWCFPSGATIHFGYAANFRQMVKRYQGSMYQYLGFDELTQWPEVLYRYLFSRCRRLETATDVPARVRGTTNPGGEGHAWVKRRFIENAVHVVTRTDVRDDIRRRHHGVLMPAPRVYESPPSDEALKLAAESGVAPQGAFFVPAFLEDNPGLDKADYRRKLMQLDPVTRAQLERGDWDVVSSGSFFKADFFKWMLPREVPQGLQWTRSWDFAATVPDPNKDPDWTAGSKQAVQRLENKEVRLIVAGMEHFQKEPGDTERHVQTTAHIDGRSTTVLLEQEGGSAGKTVVHGMKTRVLVGFTVESEKRSGPKEEYWRPVSSLASAGGVWLVEGPWNQAFIEELSNLPIGHDDQADCTSLGFAWQTKYLSGSPFGEGEMKPRPLTRTGVGSLNT